jgi:Glycosyl hydrolase family 46
MPQLSAEHIDTIMQLVALPENGNKNWWQYYNYVEYGDDASIRGYTTTIFGATTGTGSLLKVFDHLARIDPSHPLLTYHAALRSAKGGTIRGLEGLAHVGGDPTKAKANYDAWQPNSRAHLDHIQGDLATLPLDDPAWRRAVWAAFIELNWSSAADFCAKRGPCATRPGPVLTSPLALGFVVDMSLNHGDCRYWNVADTWTRVLKGVATVEDEPETWLRNLIRARRAVLQSGYAGLDWSTTGDRCTIWLGLLDAGNHQLVRPIRVADSTATPYPIWPPGTVVEKSADMTPEKPGAEKPAPKKTTEKPAPKKPTEKPVEEPAPETPGQPLRSSRLADVPGIQRTGPASTMYHGDQKDVNPPAGAPAQALALRRANRVFSYADAKRLMRTSVRDAWPVVRETFGLLDAQEDRFVALMLGQATRESTLAVDIETGTAKGYGKDSAHAYGLLQTAVTAFQGAAELYGYEAEPDVPGLYWYEWTPENFYDPLISNFMGLRKMCHFAIQARTKYKVTDPWEVLRLSLQAHNTGHANPGNDAAYMANYPDMCARMGEFYFQQKHMEDDVFTWTANHNGFATSYPAPVQGPDWRANWTWFWFV